MKKEPILSICVPTYNRAHHLKYLLISLVPEVNKYQDDVELIILDNCSTDDTPKVVAEALQLGSFRYHRNQENIGIATFFILTNTLAQGKYCWLIGDDDLIIANGLGEIIDLLKKNAEYDYFLLNQCQKLVEDRNKIITEHNSFYEPKPHECLFQDFAVKGLNAWEEVFRIDVQKGLRKIHIGTFMGVHILKRSLWEKYSKDINIPEKYWLGANDTSIYFNIDITFPHLKVVMLAMLGNPIYYLGKPYIISGEEVKVYVNVWPIFAFSLIELLVLCEKQGVDKELLDHYRNSWLKMLANYIPVFQLTPQILELKNIPVKQIQMFYDLLKQPPKNASVITLIYAKMRYIKMRYFKMWIFKVRQAISKLRTYKIARKGIK